jgi:hypothetical protein
MAGRIIIKFGVNILLQENTRNSVDIFSWTVIMDVCHFKVLEISIPRNLSSEVSDVHACMGGGGCLHYLSFGMTVTAGLCLHAGAYYSCFRITSYARYVFSLWRECRCCYSDRLWGRKEISYQYQVHSLTKRDITCGWYSYTFIIQWKTNKCTLLCNKNNWIIFCLNQQAVRFYLGPSQKRGIHPCWTDDIIKENDRVALHLPPNSTVLDPTELVFGVIKNRIASTNLMEMQIFLTHICWIQ